MTETVPTSDVMRAAGVMDCHVHPCLGEGRSRGRKKETSSFSFASPICKYLRCPSSLLHSLNPLNNRRRHFDTRTHWHQFIRGGASLIIRILHTNRPSVNGHIDILLLHLLLPRSVFFVFGGSRTPSFMQAEPSHCGFFFSDCWVGTRWPIKKWHIGLWFDNL